MVSAPSGSANDAGDTPTPAPLEVLDFGRTDPIWRALIREWAELAGPGPTFATPEFFALQLPLAPEGEHLLATAREGGHLVAVLPLVRHGTTLAPLRSDHSHLFDMIGGGASTPRLLLESLFQSHAWDMLRLDEIPEDSPLATAFVEEARATGCHVEVRVGHRCPVFALPSFEAHLKGKLRANLHRCGRKAEGLAYERLTVADDEALEEGMRIEALAWKGAAGTAINSDPKVHLAYQRMAHLAAERGELSMSFLRIGGARVAFLFGIEHGGTLHALKIGHDPAFAHLGAGHLVAWQAALDAERRGLQTFDFMGKADEWKTRWTDRVRTQVTVVVYRPTLRGTVEFAMREVIKPHAPTALAALARRIVERG